MAVQRSQPASESNRTRNWRPLPVPASRPCLIVPLCVLPCCPQGYDGGDCCICTCESETLCGTSRDFGGGFDCVDPSAECEEEEEDDDGVDEETGCNDDKLGNSVCDEENNIEACGESSLRTDVNASSDL